MRAPAGTGFGNGAVPVLHRVDAAARPTYLRSMAYRPRGPGPDGQVPRHIPSSTTAAGTPSCAAPPRITSQRVSSHRHFAGSSQPIGAPAPWVGRPISIGGDHEPIHRGPATRLPIGS